MAAFATTRPSKEFNVETLGTADPVGNTVRYPSGRCGITVMFSEYALAPAGIPHRPDGTGMSLTPAAASIGGPNAPLNPSVAYSGRVSTSRHGVTATRLNCPLMAAPRLSFAAPSM